MKIGKMIVANLNECDSEELRNTNKLAQICVEAQKKAGQTVLEVLTHEFYPHGASILVLLSESHLALHTWPEYNYQSLDIFMCGEHTEPLTAQLYIKEQIGQKEMHSIIGDRDTNAVFEVTHHY